MTPLPPNPASESSPRHAPAAPAGGARVFVVGGPDGTRVKVPAGTDGAILVVNCGSSSVKFALFADDPALTRVWSGAVEGIGLSSGRFYIKNTAGEFCIDEKRPIPSHEVGLSLLLAALEQDRSRRQIVAVGHRVVHGGADCDCPLPVDAALEDRLRRLIPLAPLHLPHNLAGIAAVRRLRPNLPQVASFDTAFHHSLPRLARMTGLPKALEAKGIRRYGFHGLSFEYVIEEIRNRDGAAAARERIIVAHLGNGASMAAIKNSRSVDVTTGFSTLAGLPMGTRSGDVDPGILLHLMIQERMKADTLQHVLYEESGLLGISGISRNMRELLARRSEADAAEAIDYFCYQARKHLASLTAVLGGLDRLVFTGGIGSNAPVIRAQIAAGLDYLAIAIDEAKNVRGEQCISPDGSRVRVEAFPTDEERMIARHVQRRLTSRAAIKDA